ncbi:polysaccharide biosynthesis/export family protein [Chitinophaga filiformis]|uniref:Polysaccharide biosynthesis/export family protein n=1 Tax=Chitinophaga filiformis TaxID=104663 RepID=A0ABY4IB88_CHIFI|nr:polysaccharide biosynthesis/export family protein [Chitinophaga filiformis]UPK72913.1 polysaccharide biosynthesis/export family protein [Chitinophaga filiformis]
MNPEDVIVFNAPSMASPGTAGGGPQVTGYLVNEQGFIEYPVLGQVKAAGLTKEQLTTYLRDELNNRKLMKDPVVSVRFLNYRVTVLGEVSRPGVFAINNERMSIMEALGIAGDITIYGKKDNVLLIREVDGQRTIKRLNLNSDDILSSPYYYLQSNDVVYVEPTKARVANASGNRQTISIILSSISLFVIILDRLILN